MARCTPAPTLGLLTSSPTLKAQRCVTQRAGSPPTRWHLVVFMQVWARMGDEEGRAPHPVFPSELPDSRNRALS